MNRGALIVLLVLLLASSFGLFRRYRDGKIFKPSAEAKPLSESHLSQRLGAPLGKVATFVQFSSAFCQPCRATRLLLDGIATRIDGVAHVEIDAESHLDLVRELNVTRTPTTFILDKNGVVVGRAVGLPKRDDVLALLSPLG